MFTRTTHKLPRPSEGPSFIESTFYFLFIYDWSNPTSSSTFCVVSTPDSCVFPSYYPSTTTGKRSFDS